MMGLLEVLNNINQENNEEVGNRLFDFAREKGRRTKLPMKPGEYFRASSLPYLCPREEVLAAKYDIIRVDDTPAMLQITFDIGHAFHRMYRDEYFGPMGEWVGAWECLRCGWNTDKEGLSFAPILGHNEGKLATMPDECLSCGGKAPHTKREDENSTITFMEWLIKDDKLRLRGHPDGWQILPKKGRVLCDLKSLSANRFPSLKHLQANHDVQVWAYEYMCKDDMGSVLYMNKSPWGDHSNFVRQFICPPDKKSFDEFIRKPLEALQNGLDGGDIPDRVCVSRTCPKAKNCQLAVQCFDSK